MKQIKKRILLLLAMVLMISNLPVQAEAANKVKINKTNATVYVGSSTTLKISGTKAKVKWSTSNKKIATVSSNGKVTGKKAGNATITAKVGKKSYKCKVTVKNPYLNKTKLSINVGKTYQLKITGTKASKWSSSKKSVATVNSKGKVTAKKAGKTTITCKGNDGKFYKCTVTVKEKHTHKYTSKVTKKATCTSEGVKTYTCSCGDSYTETIAKTAHTWDSGTVSGTTKTYKCTVCGKKKTETVECQHKNTEVRNKQSATCGHTGYTGDTYCKDCGKKISSGKKIAKTAHSWNNGKVTSKATCSQNGTKKYICTVCGEEKFETIDYVPHTYVDTVVDPTCEKQGYTEHKCSVCGYSYVDNYKNELGHDYSVEVIETQPNCYFEGTKRYKCSRCGATSADEYTLPPLGHKYVENVVEPTCTEQGYTEHKCSVCGDSETDNYVDALGHEKGSIVKTVDASKKGQGYTVYTCSRCGTEFKDDYTDFQPTEEQVYKDIMALEAKYPEGSVWDDDSVYESPYRNNYKYTACDGFAQMLSDEAFGYLPQRFHTDFSNIKVGDRIYSDHHVMVVLQIDEEGGIYTVEGNVNGEVVWYSHYPPECIGVGKALNRIGTCYPE